jgi:hypothetical protein
MLRSPFTCQTLPEVGQRLSDGQAAVPHQHPRRSVAIEGRASTYQAGGHSRPAGGAKPRELRTQYRPQVAGREALRLPF